MIRQEKGFTLLELFIALTILSVGLFALTQLAISTIHTNQWASEDSVATRLAQNKIDELKKENYVSLVINNYSDPNNPVNAQGNSGGQYTRTWSIVAGPTTGTKKLSVGVTWAGPKSVTLNTLVADEG
jgi:prepilin-type N-terminal cleavage/methylation domain-containing protein